MAKWVSGMSYRDEQQYFEESLDAYNREESIMKEVCWPGYSAAGRNPNRNNGTKHTTKWLWLF